MKYVIQRTGGAFNRHYFGCVYNSEQYQVISLHRDINLKSTTFFKCRRKARHAARDIVRRHRNVAVCLVMGDTVTPLEYYSKK